MMQKIQKFGGAMFTPVLLFAFSGIMVGITTVLTSEVIVGSIAEATTTWYKVWWTVKEGAWTIFRQFHYFSLLVYLLVWQKNSKLVLVWRHCYSI